ncbi:MAG: hypothetical protein M3O91_10225 [Chloroflexota bacterium]|nr:hypothetical protein [Chloroflexota bacterium]
MDRLTERTHSEEWPGSRDIIIEGEPGKGRDGTVGITVFEPDTSPGDEFPAWISLGIVESDPVEGPGCVYLTAESADALAGALKTAAVRVRQSNAGVT